MAEINLNHLTTCEYLMFPQGFSQYKQAVIHFLQLKRLVYTDQDKKTAPTSDVIPHSPASIPHSPDVFPHCPDVFSHSPGVNPQSPERFVSIGKGQWLDIWYNTSVAPDDPLFDLFFAYRLRQCDIMDIDQHLEASITDGITIRFITLALLKHESLFTPLQVKVISQWIDSFAARPAKDQSSFAQVKGRPKRQQGDRLTALSQEQTALFIQYLQMADVTFKGDYLNNTQAAQAFELLTGYSAEKLRKVLTHEELIRISDKKNLTALHDTLTKLTAQINHDIKTLNTK